MLEQHTTPKASPTIILFDGVCNLCNGVVSWVIAKDKSGKFRFASRQSLTGRKILSDAGVDGIGMDSVLVVENGRVHARSDAALAIAAGLGFPWSLTAVCKIVPKFLRDALYRFVAAHRYQWFGRSDTCVIPSPETRSRFLDADDPPPPL